MLLCGYIGGNVEVEFQSAKMFFENQNFIALKSFGY